MQPRTIRNLIELITSQLNDNKILNPKQNAEAIISHVLNRKRLDLYLNPDIELKDVQLKRVSDFTERIIQQEPLQYILGKTEFYGLTIKVNPAVLIPRPETEYLVEKIIMENPEARSILDIGTGSGCIAITLKKLLNKTKITATDVSNNALKIARENAKINNVQIKFIQSNIFSNISTKFDVIVSNPPYIPDGEYKRLPAEVKEFEPRNALLAEEDGIYFYRKILEKAKEYLTEKGRIYYEIGFDQAERIRKIALKNGFSKAEIIKDLNGFDRVAKIE